MVLVLTFLAGVVTAFVVSGVIVAWMLMREQRD